jgi:MioC protein
MRIVILFGTESGTAEFVAGDIAGKFTNADVVVSDMSEFDIAQFTSSDFYVIVCSTYGEGDPPGSARPLLDRLDRASPDLAGVRFALFGLGDSGYRETYNQGGAVVAARLESLGARRVGEHGRHDASGRDHPTDVALNWVEHIVEIVMADAEECS